MCIWRVYRIINDYAELNKLYQAVSVLGKLLFEQQKSITAFWQAHNDIADFEKAILQTISEMGYKQTDSVFLQLKETIAENSAIYTANKFLFGSFDTVDIYRKFADRFRDQIREQTTITIDAHKSLVEAENALDYATLDADDTNYGPACKPPKKCTIPNSVSCKCFTQWRSRHSKR